MPKNLNRLYGKLGLSEAKWGALAKKNQDDDYQLLKDIIHNWTSLRSRGATWNELYKALKACGLNDGAEILKELSKQGTESKQSHRYSD